MEKIRTKGKALVDEYGRERIFNGINVCDKGAYDEKEKVRHYQYKWDEQMLEEFKKQGVNILRLGITWDAIEPVKGKYNDTYLEAVRGMLDQCEKAGIYAYIDMHQDLYSGWGNSPGDGAPAWACYTDKYRYKNPRLVWAESYFISKATHRAFDNFWDNKYGVQDAYKKMWVHVAEKLDGHPALFGYDIMNEPFLGADGGKVFFKLIRSLAGTTLSDKRISKKMLLKEATTKGRAVHVLDQYTADIFHKIVNKTAPIVNNFDANRYMPFLDSAAAQIRKISKDSILFIENSYYSNLGIRFAGRPITVDGKRDSLQLFSPHAYDLMVDTPMYKYANNGRVGAIFAERKKEQEENLNMPLLVGEWGGHSDGTDWLHHIEYLLALFDQNHWSHTYWCYFDGIIGTPIWDVLHRPYPQAVTGTIDSYQHDRDANTFTLTYTQDAEFDVPTEIFAHKKVASVDTDGTYTIETIADGAYLVKVKTGTGRHTVKIQFEGEGFSYISSHSAENLK